MEFLNIYNIGETATFQLPAQLLRQRDKPITCTTSEAAETKDAQLPSSGNKQIICTTSDAAQTKDAQLPSSGNKQIICTTSEAAETNKLPAQLLRQRRYKRM
ncbi:hypothetical protein KY290_028753 [Solanum tuberosum]|uniref:Uncharacterized protein n=1 Tax=Solanum tuberosum TaxID=4113 RepID=A0ABQ7UIT3_SOLTU|nr:hypothetical protein KY290_028753 [Solanum tuberosum]